MRLFVWRMHPEIMKKNLTILSAKSLQSCPTLCDPRDGSPPGSPISGILQARTLEWVAIAFSNAWKWKVIVKSLSRAWLLATPWTAAYQAPPSMGFSRQEYWSGLPLPSPTILSNGLIRTIPWHWHLGVILSPFAKGNTCHRIGNTLLKCVYDASRVLHKKRNCTRL